MHMCVHLFNRGQYCLCFNNLSHKNFKLKGEAINMRCSFQEEPSILLYFSHKLPVVKLVKITLHILITYLDVMFWYHVLSQLWQHFCVMDMSLSLSLYQFICHSVYTYIYKSVSVSLHTGWCLHVQWNCDLDHLSSEINYLKAIFEVSVTNVSSISLTQIGHKTMTCLQTSYVYWPLWQYPKFATVLLLKDCFTDIVFAVFHR